MPEWLKRIIPELSEGPAVCPAPVPEAALAILGPGALIVRQVDDLNGASPAASVSTPAPVRNARIPYLATLRLVRGANGVEEVSLSATRRLTIGRDEQNDAQLLDGRASRSHGRIEYADGQYLIVDLQSANGIVVNGKRIAPIRIDSHCITVMLSRSAPWASLRSNSN